MMGKGMKITNSDNNNELQEIIGKGEKEGMKDDTTARWYLSRDEMGVKMKQQRQR